MRIFVGLDCVDLHPVLASVLPSAALAGASPRWVPAVNLHLTLAFIPSASPSLAGELAEALVWAPLLTPPGTLTFERLGVLPNPTRASVLTLEPAGPVAALRELARDCRGLVSALGLAHDVREFLPHVTVARFKRPRALPELAGLELPRALPYTPRYLRLYQSVSGSPYLSLACRDLQPGVGRRDGET